MNKMRIYDQLILHLFFSDKLCYLFLYIHLITFLPYKLILIKSLNYLSSFPYTIFNSGGLVAFSIFFLFE